MKKLVSVAAIALAATTFAAAAEARSGIKAGVLTCKIDGGVGYILGSAKDVHCKFKGKNGRVEHYAGTMGRLGVDLGITGEGTLAWLVIAPGKLKAGSLAGNYAGVSAQATVGAGLGANVLVGGFKKSINLQPISVQGQTGLNAAAGLANLSLHSAN
jgi:Protein of unknown function (DUF992)